jgi:hypothetical protein
MTAIFLYENFEIFCSSDESAGLNLKWERAIIERIIAIKGSSMTVICFLLNSISSFKF